MSLDLSKFAGTLPYSAELFGVYHPILGWKARRALTRIGKEQFVLIATGLAQLREKGPSTAELLDLPRPIGPDDLVPEGVPALLATRAGAKVRNVALAFEKSNGHLPTPAEWPQVVARADLPSVLAQVADEVRRRRVSRARLPSRSVQGGSRARALLREGPSMIREAAAAGALMYMAKDAPHSLTKDLGLGKQTGALLPSATDLLANFDPQTQQTVLSPVGVLNLYREYFFEFETFHGPPVGHVWVSPGGSLELFEVHTRRTKEERQIELATEMRSKSETEVAEEDELSTAVAEENSRDIALGVSATASADFGVVQASASASFDMGFNTKKSEETAHKHSRRQSEKLSNEIRRNHKTTFRTSVETEDVSSRRYVLQNTTDKLVNYELRRKMRQVGVQVQHLGTQLCWQTYVDNPGETLGVAALVHAAQPEDLLPDAQQPDAPAQQPMKASQFPFTFAFEPTDEEAMDDGADEDYIEGHDVEEDPGVGLINWYKDITIDPPANAIGYTLVDCEVIQYMGTGEGDEPPQADTSCEILEDQENTFRVKLNTVNFKDHAGINLVIGLVWKPLEPTAEQKKAAEEKQKEFEDQKRRAAHGAYVKAVRERIKLASNVRPRPPEDLREEERTVVYRRLIADLTKVPSAADAHMTSELIRAIFDVDKLLYYVAPEWWTPRMYSGQQFGQYPEPKEKEWLTEGDKLSWGGAKEFGRPNYLITEDSEPARLGASLGWLIQLDGDARRNAFLNSPWVTAVIPIRPGRELAALNWLKLAHVEGTEGLDATYGGPEPKLQGTIEHALRTLAKEIGARGEDIKSTLATEKVFERGFDPLEGGFRATGEPFEMMDQWIEVLPTDQVVAVEYPSSPDEGNG